MHQSSEESVQTTKVRWLTRNVFAIGMLSLFCDAGHELITAVLPLFLQTFGGGAIALGTIEGVSDACSSLVKMWMAYFSDRIGKRKPILVFGYLLTALMGNFAFVTRWWQLVVIRALAWIGRGARGPVRDALLSESVPAAAHGRAFGFEGAMDTVGAILGPAVALSLIGVISLRHIFLVSFIPGLIAVFIVLFMLQDLPRLPRPHLRFWTSLRALPSRFWPYLAAVGVFGLGNFAHTLLVLRAVVLLTPKYGHVTAGRIGVGLYILHNVLYAAVSYPAGLLGDKGNKRLILALGYALFGVLCLLFMANTVNLGLLVAVFVLAGVYVGIVDAMQRALAADVLPLDCRAVGYGALATVNSFGDLLSSLVVGVLWSRVSYSAGLSYAAVLTLAGSILLLLWRPRVQV